MYGLNKLQKMTLATDIVTVSPLSWLYCKAHSTPDVSIGQSFPC